MPTHINNYGKLKQLMLTMYDFHNSADILVEKSIIFANLNPKCASKYKIRPKYHIATAQYDISQKILVEL